MAENTQCTASGYDGYTINIPHYSQVDPTKYLQFYQKLQQLYVSESTKRIFDMDQFRASQQLDTKIRCVYDYLLSKGNDTNYLDILHKSRDNVWFKGLTNNYFHIHNDLLMYNDNKQVTCFDEGRLVVPDVFKIALVKHFHFYIHTVHGGVETTLALLRPRYWWQNMQQDVEFILSSCMVCAQAKGKSDNTTLNSWYTTQPGELIFYDFAGPYFKSGHISAFVDDHTGITQLRFVTACDAIVVCNLLLNHWVPVQGFPIQMIGDLGSSNFNDLVHCLFEISGIDGLYASPRRHQAIGKVERLFREMNKQFRLLNVELEGEITNDLSHERALFEIQQFLPAIESFINSTISTKTGFSPNLLDKGRQLRGIGDIKNGLKILKRKIKQGCKKPEQVLYLQDLQRKILLYRYQKNKYELSYLMRSCNNHDSSRYKTRKYRKGEFVGFYIGDQSNKNIQKWNARYAQCIFIENLNNGQVKIRDLTDNKIKTVSRGMIRPFKVNDPLWKSEMDYQELVAQRQSTTSGQRVTFQDW